MGDNTLTNLIYAFSPLRVVSPAREIWGISATRAALLGVSPLGRTRNRKKKNNNN